MHYQTVWSQCCPGRSHNPDVGMHFQRYTAARSSWGLVSTGELPQVIYCVMCIQWPAHSTQYYTDDLHWSHTIHNGCNQPISTSRRSLRSSSLFKSDLSLKNRILLSAWITVHEKKPDLMACWISHSLMHLSTNEMWSCTTSCTKISPLTIIKIKWKLL